MKTEIKLQVGKAQYSDIGRDIVRINIANRPPDIERHDLIRLWLHNRSVVVVVRGNEEPNIINLDIDIRRLLDVDVGEVHYFKVEKVDWFGKFIWQCRATDPAVRLPAQIAAISFVLGVIGLFLGVFW